MMPTVQHGALWLGDLHGCGTDHLVTGFGNGTRHIKHTWMNLQSMTFIF
jgi:hypothetical protein